MSDYTLIGNSLNKSFGRRLIFRNLNFNFNTNGIYGIAGSNGSGKSTLVKIIAGLNAPSAGEVKHLLNGKEIAAEKLHDYIGFVSPYLVLYDEFTASENLKHFSNIRGKELNKSRSEYLLDLFLLSGRRNDLLKTYSSGMKQRMKFIFALIHSPRIIILDEPTSNLDNEGKDKVYTLITEESRNAIVLIASNEETDLSLCSSIIQIESYKN